MITQNVRTGALVLLIFLFSAMLTVNICTWNVRGLRAREKQNEVIAMAKQNKIDILAVQETHINDTKFIKDFDKIFGVKSYWSFAIGRSGGVAILLFGKYRDLVLSHEHDWSGRVVTVDLKLGLKILNIYAPLRSKEQIEFFNDLDHYACNARKLVVVGDFNCVENEIGDRLPARDRNVTYGAKSLIDFRNRCNLEDCWNKLHPGRPIMTWKGTGVEARLDRVYATANLINEVQSTGVEDTVVSDHRPLTIKMRANGNIRGKGLWKLNPMLLEDERVNIDVRETLGRRLGGDVNEEQWDALKEDLKKKLTNWGKKIAVEKREELRRVADAIVLLSKKGTTGPGLEEARIRLKQKYSMLLKKRWDTVKLKLRAENWELEHWASRHLISKQLGPCRHEITAIKREETGEIISDEKDIQRCVADYYEKLYKTEAVSFTHTDLSFAGITEKNESGVFTTEELTIALKSLDGKKAPGEDGLRASFYKKYWSVIGRPFTRMINHAVRNGKLPSSFYRGTIVLICKDEKKRDQLKSWRPITLLNLDYKIFAKALANRIYPALPAVVSDTQAANIAQRSTQHNIAAITDIMHWIERTNNAGAVFAIDSEKAFDRVNHNYMFRCLEKINWNDNLTEMIRLIYKEAISRVLVNGHATREIRIERGVRQGCPLSAALFIITMEPLLQKIKQKTTPLFLPIIGKVVPVFAFADDVTVIINGAEEVKNVLQACESYERISGAKINKEKSELLFFGSKSVDTDEVYGVPVKREIKILGTYFNCSGPSKTNWWYKMKDLKEKIQQLEKIRVTIFARFQIAKSLILSPMQYIAQTLQPDKKTIKKLDRIIFPYIWGSRVEGIKRSWLKEPKERGGYGILDLDLVARASHVVWTLRMLDSDMPLVSAIVRFSLGTGIRFIEGSIDNTKPRLANPRSYYQQVISDYRLILNRKKDANVRKMGIAEVVNLLRDEKQYVVRKPLRSAEPDWKSISSPFLEATRNTFMWRLAHGILPRLNYHRNTRHVPNICNLCGRPESLQHFFYGCRYLEPFIKKVKTLFQGEQVTYSALRFLSPAPKNMCIKRQFILMVSELSYQNWRMRCSIAHGQQPPHIETFFAKWKNEVRWSIRREQIRLTKIEFDKQWKSPAVIFSITDNSIQMNW